MATALMEVDSLKLALPTSEGGTRPILANVSFSIFPGEIVGLRGPSGCGKSQTANCLLGLWPPGARVQGTIRWPGLDNLLDLPQRRWESLRGSQIGFMPQDTGSTLNPLFSIGHHLSEVLRLKSTVAGRKNLEQEGMALLEQVALPNPSLFWQRYPHELSGGQRQRVLLALALARGPRLLVADEPTTALDVCVQAQILTMLLRLRAVLNLAILLISHDSLVVSRICDRVIEMDEGTTQPAFVPVSKVP